MVVGPVGYDCANVPPHVLLLGSISLNNFRQEDFHQVPCVCSAVAAITVGLNKIISNQRYGTLKSSNYLEQFS